MLGPDLISFFKELDVGKRTMLRPVLVSFFKELDIGKRTMLRTPCFIF